MYTLDASVWVNACDQREPGHAISRQLITLLRERAIAVILPTLALPEIAGSVSRTRTQAFGAAYVRSVVAQQNVEFVNLSAALARQAMLLAAAQRLRGADAVYAALARRRNTTLVSRDAEHLTRLTAIIVVQTPEQVLESLTAPT